jgi:hypothetical protein
VDTSALAEKIRAGIVDRALPGGGWADGSGRSAGIETTCLALMALRETRSPAHEKSRRLLERLQNKDGSWRAFAGDDPQGCWTTALACIALRGFQTESDGGEKALRWILRNKGRESHWLWNLKFKFADRKVRFDPDKYGWSWFPGTVSWVIPTAFTLIALQHAFPCCQTEPVSGRIRLGTEMLIDRACPGGGWNAGNGVVLGSPLRPHIDATAIALIALPNRARRAATVNGLSWLKQVYVQCSSPYSLAWSTLAFAAHRDHALHPCIERLGKTALARLTTLNVDALSVTAIAFDVAEGKANPFQAVSQ